MDWFGTGKLDLVTGNFLDSLTVYRRGEERAMKGVPIAGVKLDLCMIQPRTVTWRKGFGPSLVVAEEDGTLSLLREQRAGRAGAAVAAGAQAVAG